MDDRRGDDDRGGADDIFDASERKAAEHGSKRIQPIDGANCGVGGIIDFGEPVQVAQVQRVIPVTANDHISAAGVGVDIVIPGTRRGGVDSGSAMDGVVSGPGGDGVGAVTRLDAIVAAHRGDRINAAAGVDDVVARAGGDRVGAVTSDYDVGTAANRDRIRATAGDDPVNARECRAGGDRVGPVTGAYVVVAAAQRDRIRAAAGGDRVIARSGRAGGDRVGPVAHVDHIVADPKRDRADTRFQATGDVVVAVATGNRARPGTDGDDVVAVKERDGVHAEAGRDDVVASPGDDRRGPVTGLDGVVARARGDRINAAAGDDEVLAVASDDRVGPVASIDDVIAGARGDDIDTVTAQDGEILNRAADNRDRPAVRGSEDTTCRATCDHAATPVIDNKPINAGPAINQVDTICHGDEVGTRVASDDAVAACTIEDVDRSGTAKRQSGHVGCHRHDDTQRIGVTSDRDSANRDGSGLVAIARCQDNGVPRHGNHHSRSNCEIQIRRTDVQNCQFSLLV